MNFQTILEELDRLYEEENVKKENEKTEDTATETEQELTEAAEDISDEEEISGLFSLVFPLRLPVQWYHFD